MLRTAMGPVIAAALEDPEVVEVLLNPDGSLWLDRLRTGRERTDVVLPADDAERIIRLVAAHLRLEVHRSEEHTSELQSLMRSSYAVFCLKKKKKSKITYRHKATESNVSSHITHNENNDTD